MSSPATAITRSCSNLESPVRALFGKPTARNKHKGTVSPQLSNCVSLCLQAFLYESWTRESLFPYIIVASDKCLTGIQLLPKVIADLSECIY